MEWITKPPSPLHFCTKFNVTFQITSERWKSNRETNLCWTHAIARLMIAADTSVLCCNPFCNYRDDPSLETSTQSPAWALIVLMGWLSLASPRVWLSSTVLARVQQRRQSLAPASLTVLLLPKSVLISYYTFGLCLCWISSHWLQIAAEVLELVYSFSSGTKALVSPVRLVPLQLLLGFSANPSPWSIPSCTAHSAEDEMPNAPSHLPCSLLISLCQQCSRSQPVSMYYISFLWSTRPVTLKNSIIAVLCGTALLKPYSTGCSLIYQCLHIDHSVIRPRIFLDSIFRLPNLSCTVMLLNPGQKVFPPVLWHFCTLPSHLKYLMKNRESVSTSLLCALGQISQRCATRIHLRCASPPVLSLLWPTVQLLMSGWNYLLVD